MKVLTKIEIEKLGNKLISPFEKRCLTPVGYDLRVGGKNYPSDIKQGRVYC